MTRERIQKRDSSSRRICGVVSAKTCTGERRRTGSQTEGSQTRSGFQDQKGSTRKLIQLQRCHGNRAVQRLVRGEGRSRPGEDSAGPGEKYEREANAVADRVAAGQSAPAISRIGSAGGRWLPERRSAGDDERAGATDRAIARSSGGRLIPARVRAPIEASLQRDLSDVRVHDDAAANRAAREIGARAFTHGTDVWLGPRGRASDLRLMAHETAHVVQQSESSGTVVQRQEETGEGVSPAVQTGGDVAAGTGTVFEYEAILRGLYQRSDEAIYREAQYMLREGVPGEEVARWAVDARNQAKAKIRRFDQEVLKRLAEQRNVRRYGDPLGPTYEQLRYGDPERGIGPRSDLEIVESARKTSPRTNKWVGRFRIAGRIMIFVDIGIGAYNVISAPESERPRTLFREAGGLAGVAAGGLLGAKIGGAIGGLFGGVGAIPGAAIGGVIGGIGGAIGGGIAGRELGDYLYETLYPPAETEFEGEFR